MAHFKTSKTEIAKLLKAQNLPFRDWGDALAIHFSDACDDFYYTESNAYRPAEFIVKFQTLDLSRTRVLNALRHAAYKRSLFLELDKSGSWSVGSKYGTSWSVEVGASLTALIDQKSEAEAFRIKLKELCSQKTSAGCLGSIGSRLIKNILGSISFQSTDKQIDFYINFHSKPPKHEHTWEEFEELEDECGCVDFFPDNDEKEEDDFQTFFNKFQKEGPELIKPDELQKSKIDQSSASRIKTFLKTLDKERISYDKIFQPWFNAPDDIWLKSDFLIEKLEAQAIKARENDDFWNEIGCLEQLLVLKCDKYRERTLQLMDEWRKSGGHDMQDYVELLNAFPSHLATTEMLEPYDMSPETSMDARRRIEVDIQREWEELKNYYKKDRVVKLDDILEIMNKLSFDMIKKLMTEEQIHYIRRFCMEAAKSAKVEDMQFSHEHILHTAWKMGWTEIAKTMRQRDDYSDLLFGFSMNASEIESWAGKTAGKVSESIGAEVPSQNNVPEVFDTYYFAKSLLIWSLFMPDEYTQRLITTALDVLKKGEGRKDDYLACAIAWQRCRMNITT